MIKQELVDRIAQINLEMTQLKANYAKLEGHLCESQHWLDQLLKSEMDAEIQEKEELEQDKLGAE